MLGGCCRALPTACWWRAWRRWGSQGRRALPTACWWRAWRRCGSQGRRPLLTACWSRAWRRWGSQGRRLLQGALEAGRGVQQEGLALMGGGIEGAFQAWRGVLQDGSVQRPSQSCTLGHGERGGALPKGHQRQVAHHCVNKHNIH